MYLSQQICKIGQDCSFKIHKTPFILKIIDLNPLKDLRKHKNII